MRAETPALPPVHLAARVGATHADNHALYEEFGAETRDEILALLPSDWSLEGKRVLDFGSAPGARCVTFSARQRSAMCTGATSTPKASHGSSSTCAHRYGCSGARSSPLPLPDGSLDRVWAISVFTHLTHHWSAWLLELHRVLADAGLLIATFNGPGALAAISDESWEPDRVGMNVLLHDQSWDRGGPAVLLSPWWLDEHWGRLFEVVTLREDGFAVRSTRDRTPATWGGQGVVLLRRKELEDELSVLLTSESWRITALLRFVGRHARAAFRTPRGRGGRLSRTHGREPDRR